ncbi:MAG: hypothetical protein JWO37_2531, partial [Acidimicrobiales bacterium]|nr:hypothetical protein [Acidimicrobiales bacterium]
MHGTRRPLAFGGGVLVAAVAVSILAGPARAAARRADQPAT